MISFVVKSIILYRNLTKYDNRCTIRLTLLVWIWSLHRSATLAQLVARSRRLGADRSICNWGGGNTSAKANEVDHRGHIVRVLWVKGSGSDLATVTEASFTGLYLDDVLPLIEREQMSDAEMVDYLAHCFYEPGRPRPSIETLLHGFLPFTHIDHTHADATNFFACAADGERLARECFGDQLVWVPYMRPGFSLARHVALAVRDQPRARLVILAKHGLITWGNTDEECYANTLETIARARTFVERRLTVPAFGGQERPILEPAERRAVAAASMPIIRGLVSAQKPCVLRFEDTPDVLEFVASREAPRLVTIGAACPDHLVHTKPWPLLLDGTNVHDQASFQADLRTGITAYVARYNRYLEENATQNLDPAGSEPVYRSVVATPDPFPRVILIRGVGMITTGKDAHAAEITAQLYHRAIAVMRGAEACGGFISLTEAESHAVEYWPLEQYKLTLAPPEREFARRVALVTGGAGGIGSAICWRLARDGAHVLVADIDEERANAVAANICYELGCDCARGLAMDVTQEASVREAFAEAVRAYGGIDIVVSNAGLASSAPVEETTLAEWRRNMDVLATGTFLVAREAFRVFKQQGRGGSLVIIASKNALVAAKNASAYSAAKAAELHLARCLAEEGGPYGIRVNTVNPDAVLQGSHIWDSEWRQERAATYGIAPEQLEEYYRRRTVLGVNVLPEDVAEAVAYFASPQRSGKSTANILNVDGGITAAYSR
jgi:rhamnulose-1-phosphate aldolase/alcohol dehydrogenase